MALPQFSDLLGWKQPMYHSTIQVADIDGDRQDEVLARWIDGMHIWRFQDGVLLEQPANRFLSDNAGFTEPSWYSTIQTAVLDPKLGQADIVARKSDGIHTFRYDRQKQEWAELGANASARPFADVDPSSGSDWTQEKHYLTIQAGDLDQDGTAELVGRSGDGIQVYRWDKQTESWAVMTSTGQLSDAMGFDQEAYYSSVRLIDLDKDGAMELIARAPEGMQTYKWNAEGWTLVSTGGPFRDEDGFNDSSKRHKSVGAYNDETGQTWLYGLSPGANGVASDSIDVHRWKDGSWQATTRIPVGEGTWHRESQLATLKAVNLQGDAKPEFLIRGPRGLQAYTLSGRRLPTSLRPFRDAKGWNLSEQYQTVRIASVHLQSSGSSIAHPVVIGRGRYGLEAYKYSGQWTEAADSNFPAWANQNQITAYQWISQDFLNVDDMRTKYTDYTIKSTDWTNIQSRLKTLIYGGQPIPNSDYVAVQSALVTELGYVATVRGWFDNNLDVLTDSYNQSSNLLSAAVSSLSANSGTNVISRWLEFVADTIGKIAGILGQPQVMLVTAILENTLNNLTANAGGDITKTVAAITADLNTQRSQVDLTNATTQTGYLTDYSKLLQIGKDSETNKFDWSQPNLEQVAEAKDAAAQGMTINFYRSLLPTTLQVSWSYGNTPPTDTPDIYDCIAGEDVQGTKFPLNESYVETGDPPFSPAFNWAVADNLTGTANNGDLDAIWYMMLLGGNLGWDLSNPNPYYNYDAIKNGFPLPSDGCGGNGSRTGLNPQSNNEAELQTIPQRLAVVQHNGRHVRASEADDVLRALKRLTLATRSLRHQDRIEVELNSLIRESRQLIAQAKRALPPNAQFAVEGSISATTPTHLMETFVSRVEQHEAELGKLRAENLAIAAHDVINRLEGQE